MKNIICLLLFLMSSFAQADLYDRILLEDSLRSRVENILKVYDHNIRVLVRIEYKNFQGVLPGTSIISEDSFTPLKVESNDIMKINIELYTSKKDLNPDAQALIYKIIPFDKSKINLETKTVDSVMAEEMKKSLDRDSVSNIMKESTEHLTKWFSGLTLLFLIVSLGFAFYLNQKQLEAFKSQMTQIATALKNSESEASAGPVWTEEQTTQETRSSEGSEETLKKISGASLKELLADCYWCGQDTYASWIWKKLSNEQRRELISGLAFMKDYSHFIVDLKSTEESYHDHPYYLEPSIIGEISQIDLTELVQQNISLWHVLSPMRQHTLPLPLESKLNAVQSKPGKVKIQSSKKSPYRELTVASTMGDLSAEDEKALYEKPELVPATFKRQVRSLVWLALQPESTIQSVLARFDARSLASAWIGPEEVLVKLEKNLPEKKLKLLQTYKSKTTPSRNAPAYQQLVNEGWRNEAA